MNKAEWSVLEQIFVREIDDTLPYQGGSKAVRSLSENGFIEPMVRTFGGRFPVAVQGWCLTEPGRIAWCQHCAEMEDP